MPAQPAHQWQIVVLVNAVRRWLPAHRGLAVTLGLTGLLLLLLPALLDRPAYRLYVAPQGWTVSGGFHPAEGSQPGRLPEGLGRAITARFWRNYSPSSGMQPGEVRTSPFELRRAEVLVPVLGYTNSQFAGVYLERTADGRRIALSHGAAHEWWATYRLQLPGNFVGEKVRVVAWATTDTYIGVGTPYYRTNSGWPALGLSRVLGLTLTACAYSALIFLGPLAAIPTRLRDRWRNNQLLVGFICISGLLLTMFYVAYFWPLAGRCYAAGWIATSAVLVVRAALNRQIRLSSSDWQCLLLIGGLTTAQTLFVFSFDLASIQFTANYLFFPAAWSTDNQIPVTLAQLLARGTLQTDWSFGEWKISDRTPLLGAMLYPAAVILASFRGVLAGTEAAVLQACGIGILNSWVVAVWAMCRRFRLDLRRSTAVVLLLALTPFVFVNSIYIWPKLLAGAFCLAQCTFLLASARGGAARAAPWLSGAAGGLAIMSHSAAAIAVFATVLAVAVVVGRRSWLNLLISGIAASAFVLPWMVWTRACNPSTNPLPKFYLTGDFDFANGKGSLSNAVRQFYSGLSGSSWLQTRIKAGATIAGVEQKEAADTLRTFGEAFTRYDSLRGLQFFFLVPAFGLLAVPFAVFTWRRSAAARPHREGGLMATVLLLSAALILVIQLALMMAPHWLHHYPYYFVLVPHLAAAIALVRTRSWALLSVGLLNTLLFLIYWIALIIIRTPVSSAAGVTLATLLVGVGAASVWVSLLRARALDQQP